MQREREKERRGSPAKALVQKCVNGRGEGAAKCDAESDVPEDRGWKETSSARRNTTSTRQAAKARQHFAVDADAIRDVAAARW